MGDQVELRSELGRLLASHSQSSPGLSSGSATTHPLSCFSRVASRFLGHPLRAHYKFAQSQELFFFFFVVEEATAFGLSAATVVL